MVVDFAGSPLIFPGRAAPASKQAFNARIKLACELPWPVHCFAGNLRQLGKREEANAAVSNNSLFERVNGRAWFRLLFRTDRR